MARRRPPVGRGPRRAVSRPGGGRRPRRRRTTGRRRTTAVEATSFVAAVGAVAAALRVGAGPEVAWRRVGVRTDDGVPRAADLAGLGGAGPRQVTAVVAAARLSLQVGTPAAEMLERATIAVARDAEAEGRRRTALAGPRATASLLVWLPGGGLLLGVGVGARPWEQVLGGGAGTASAVVGLTLLLVGRRWTAREIRAAERAGDRPAPGASVPVGEAGPGQTGGRSGRRSERRRDADRQRRRRWGRVAALADPQAPGSLLPAIVGDPAGGARAADGGARAGARARAGCAARPAPARGGRADAAAGARGGRVGGIAGGGDRAAARSRARPVLPEDDAVEGAVLLDLVDGACQAGVGVPRALDAVGVAVGGRSGADLRRAARRLALGAPWDSAWHGTDAGLAGVARALRPAWEDGVPPGALLRTAAEAARRERDARAAEAAARLGVRLVMPLGLCHLPAFVLVGLVPVLGSMATTTLGA